MLKVGISKVDITPELGVHLFGYPYRERPAEEIYDHLYATAIVFEQGEMKACHVTLDLCEITDVDVESIRNLASGKTGIPANHINIGVTHTHSGPQTASIRGWGDKDVEYTSRLIPKVVQAIERAAAKTVEVTVGFATTQTRVGVNRRSVQMDDTNASHVGQYNYGPYDSTMTVVRFESSDGLAATLIHCSAHGTAMGSNRLISRDWPGVMIDRVESQTKAPVIFINGAYGDCGPRTNRLLAPGLFSAGTGDGIHAVNEVGYRGATDALFAHQSIKYFNNNLELKVYVGTIDLPLAPLPSIETAHAKLKEYESRKDEWGEGMCYYKYWQHVIESHSRKPQDKISLLQTIITIGPLALIPMPGEPFSSISMRLRRYSPFQYTLVCGGTNAMLGYLSDRESRHRGGYENWSSVGYLTQLLTDNIDDVLVSENLRLLEVL